MGCFLTSGSFRAAARLGLEEAPPLGTESFRVKRRGIVLLVLLVLAGIGLGIFLGYRTVVSWRHYKALSAEAEVVKAEVIERWISRDAEGDETYHLAYRFELDDEEYEGKSWVSWHDYRNWTEGSSVDVLYSPQDPAVNRLAAYFGPGETIGLGVVSLLTLAGSLWVLTALRY